ncbi:hypothetical protein KP509_11G096800 [Ceratopteris richardii]|uniref:Uncharacterized protein n=1 Tax=Ceratopteris richardii TaxID=49495 RepID=A0A8T2TV95_CERRI|nr:hypothetical protein KP509_11G096800 [Ceratopteris richardii]
MSGTCESVLVPLCCLLFNCLIIHFRVIIHFSVFMRLFFTHLIIVARAFSLPTQLCLHNFWSFFIFLSSHDFSLLSLLWLHMLFPFFPTSADKHNFDFDYGALKSSFSINVNIQHRILLVL